AGIALGAAAVAALGGVCFGATSSPFRPLGRAHPYAVRTNFRREGLMPALLNFCAQVPNTGFSAFLPLWALGHGRAAVLVPALAGVAVALGGLAVATGWPAFLALSLVYGALFGVAFVILPALAGEAAPPEGRGAALNTFGLGSDLAQLLGPWGLGLAAGAWGFGGALVAAGLVATVGMAAGLARGAAGR